MQITIFSVWMTFVWCSIFIVLCYILRKRSVLLNLSSMTGIIILYLFCLIRLAVPVELPWTKVVSGGSLYNFLYQIFGCEITCVAGHEIYVYHIFVVAWGVVMAVLLTRYLIQYHRVVSYFSEMEKTEDTELNNILDEICTDKEKRNIKIVQTAAVEVPCCMGIFFINDSFANYNSSGSSHACACCSYSEARERRSPAEHGSQSSFSASVR